MGDAAFIYCIVPRDLGRRVATALARMYDDDPNVEVLIERRQAADRRDDDDDGRRRSQRFVRSTYDKRLITNGDGRRIAERRRTLVPTYEQMPLPRHLRRYAGHIKFVGGSLPIDRRIEDVASARCVTRVQSGDAAAVEDLYRFWFDRVYNYYRVIGLRGDELEAAVQDAFRRAFEALASYDYEGHSFRGWLARSIVGAHPPLSLTRSRSEALILARMVGDGGDRAVARLRDEELVLLMRQLPSPHREVAAMRYVFGLMTAEAARVLGCDTAQARILHDEALGLMRGWALAAQVRRGSPRRHPATSRRREAPVLRSRRLALAF